MSSHRSKGNADPFTRPSKKTRNGNLVHNSDDEIMKETPTKVYKQQVEDTIGVNPDQVESILAKEMASLSVDARQKLYFDVHGVRPVIEETSELISTSIQNLKGRLEAMVTSTELKDVEENAALRLAMKVNEDYVLKSSTLKMFLRADEFDVNKAAIRMQKSFDVKLDLFGRDKLCRDLHMDDLDLDTIEIVYSGRIQNIAKDQTGRVVSIAWNQSSKYSVRAKLRAAFYLTMLVTVGNEDVQKRGVSTISYLVDQDLKFFEDFEHRKEWNLGLARLSDACPHKTVSVHICHNYLPVRILLAVLKAVTSTIRLRFREHYGTAKECFEALRCFGISSDGLELDENGNIPVKGWHTYLEEERAKERKIRQELIQMKQSKASVVFPSKYDVLLGRGKSYYGHAGNVYLRELVEAFADEYESAKQQEKAKITQQIVDAIKSKTGYFLSKDVGIWKEAENNTARLKVSHLFRTRRRLCKEGDT